MEKQTKPNRMVWTGNGWHLARGVREIRRGKKKGKHEVKFLKGSRLKKIIVSASSIREVGA